MLKTLVITLVLLAAALLLMAFKILLVKGGRFPSGHVHDLARRRGRNDIVCARRQALGQHTTRDDR